MEEKNIPLPDPERFPFSSPYFDEIILRHTAACIEGKDFYEDPATGYLVMTSFFLKERKTCCNTGCRHCPYLSA